MINMELCCAQKKTMVSCNAYLMINLHTMQLKPDLDNIITSV